MKLDFQLVWRDWRGGQLNLILSALVLAVTIVTAVGLLTDRVERGLNDQISSFLAADLAVQSTVALEPTVRNQAQQIGLSSANIALFGSMIFYGERNHLASVKVLDDNYPLRGRLILRDANGKHFTPSDPPGINEAWVDERLLNLLDAQIGDELEVGYSRLRISAIIDQEPDRGTGFATRGARIMMSWPALEQAQLVRPGSRITYRLLLAGSDTLLKQYTDWFEQNQTALAKASHYRLRTPENAQQGLADSLQRGQSFLLLSGSIGVLLAGLAIALASQRYAQRLTDQVALMKAWGVSAKRIRLSQFRRLLIITLAASSFGMMLGWLAHFVLLEIAASLFDAVLPAAGLQPWFIAITTGLVCVLGFALPALWHLPGIAPLKVLRRDLSDSLVSSSARFAIGTLALIGLTFWYSASWLMTGLFLGALLLLITICAVVAWQALKLVRHLGRWQGSYLRLGLANLWRRRNQSLLQLVGFSITLMLLLLTIGLRTSLLDEWRAQLPDNAPTHFVFNISENEFAEVNDILAQNQVVADRWYAMVRGRISGLNGEPINPQRLARASGLNREVNFTQARELPDQNRLVRGTWWDQLDNDKTWFSLEQEVAEELGVQVGDRFEFSIGGIKLEAELASIRSVNWENMQANFYVIFNPGTLDRFAPNWVSSVRAYNHQQHERFASGLMSFERALFKSFPTVVVIHLGEIIKRIKLVIDRVTMGLELILYLVLACGALVLFATIGISYDERAQESAVLRTLGSSQKVISGALATEFATLGLISGVIAALGAETLLYFAQTELFELSWRLHPGLWLIGVLSGTTIVTTLGLLRSRAIIKVPPLQSLRQLA